MSSAEASGDKFVPETTGFAASMAWLHDHDLSTTRIAALFKIKPGNVRQILWRYDPARRLTVIRPVLSEPLVTAVSIHEPVTPFLRQALGIRGHEDSVLLDRAGKRRLSDLEADVEMFGSEFWSGVRYATGLRRLYDLLPKIGYSAHHRRLSLLGRIRQLICETHLHSGRTASAINEGLASIHLYRVAYQQLDQQSAWKGDLENLGRSARLVSQAYLLRHEPKAALHYLGIHREAAEAAGVGPRPEYFHQRATAAFQMGEDEPVPADLTTAMNRLRDTADYGVPKAEHEVRDIGLRALYLVRGDWDNSSELLESAVKNYPAGDIHVSINAGWTAACGFATQHEMAAMNILDRYEGASVGYGRQATIFRLLRLTPELPAKIRRDWVRHALYTNAFADQ